MMRGNVTNLLTMKGEEKMVKALTDSARLLQALALEKDNHVTLFRKEDMVPWLTFTCAFVVLIIFDNLLLHRNPKSLTLGRAACYTFFWIACAGGVLLLRLPAVWLELRLRLDEWLHVRVDALL